MGYKTKSMINQRGPGQLPGFDIENFKSIDNNLKKLTTKFKGINETKAIQEIRKKEGPSGAINTSNLLQENLNKESSKSSSPTKAKKKLIEGRKLKRSQRKEVREAGKEAAKDVDTSFKKAELAGTDFNSLLIGTIQNLTSSSKASSKKRKVKKAAKDTKREMLSKGRPTEPMGELGNKKSQTLNAIKTSIAPEKSKVTEASAVTKNTNKTNTAPIPGSDPFLVPKNANTIDSKLGDDIMRFGINPNQKTAKGPAKDQYDFNPPSYIDRTIEKIQDFIGVDKLPAPRELFGFQMTGDGFNKGMLRKNKYKK